MNTLRTSCVLLSILSLSACVSSKKYKALESQFKTTESALQDTRLKLGLTEKELEKCLELSRRAEKQYEEELKNLRSMNSELLQKVSDLTHLSRQEAENLQASLQKIREKDLQIKALHEALSRKDSVTLALVTSLKRAVGIYDKDIEINVEKGVIFISISDKFLFKSGSYAIKPEAQEVLRKVALVLNDHPKLEVLVEGHTDNVPFRRPPLMDNWDLSVKRATSLVRMLQNEFKIAPERMIAAGRGEYVPVAPNDTPENKALNRRTRILILPKLEEFVGLIQEQLGGK
ncbi:MAG: OmpA family protein [Flavobacteriales bacterium]|nr:OmpA family protein [Flavobacteriales bacterium]MCX7649465.1 OmpA family protein [Flavobacteriales bacterium]MDW8431830.1 OmpA family protein [Flavobacteriales bacterium]